LANIRCPCGEVFSDAEVPSPHLFHLIPNEKVEGLVREIREIEKKGEDVEARIGFVLMSTGRDVYKCPKCGRLLVFEGGGRELASSYSPD
jgi:predicted RNA-binding Zn-ribbon protein involved in translation (DUF1610 family)